jgi:superfamily II DNA/RNA helicase
MPDYEAQLDQQVVPVDCSDFLDQLAQLPPDKPNVLALEQILTQARLHVIRQKLQENSQPTVIYCHLIDGIVEVLAEALTEDGWRVGLYTGDDKSGMQGFLDGEIDVLIASPSIAIGVDGLQQVCSRMIINVLPWTNAEYIQLVGRLIRTGQLKNSVEVIIPQTFALIGDQTWSLCQYKWQRLAYKASVADAAVDGVIPQGQLQSPDAAYKAIMGWLHQLREKEIDKEV